MPSFVSGTNLLEQAGVTLTTSGDTTGLSGRNLLTSTLAEVWRTVASSGAVAADLGTAQPVLAVVLAAPRDGLLPLAGATAQLTASNVSSVGAEIYASGIVTLALPRGYQCWVLPNVVTARFWRLTLAGPASQPYLQFGRLWIGSGLYLTNYLTEDGNAPTIADTDLFAPRRQVQVTLPNMSQAQADVLEDIALALGTQRQGLFIPRTERADRTALFGKFTTIPAPKPRQAWAQGVQQYTATLAVSEDR